MAQHPKDLIALVRLGALYERTGAADKAIKTYEQALKANPQAVSFMVKLARLHSEHLHDNPKALQMAKQAQKLASDDAQVGHVLGRLAYETGDQKWAFSLLQQSALKQPNRPAVLYDLALAQYSVGRTADAEASLRKALQSTNAFPQADAAKRCLEMIPLADNPAKAAQARPRIDDVLKALPACLRASAAQAAAIAHQADLVAARQSYEKILSRYPDFLPAQKRLAALYADTGVEAQKAYDLAVKARAGAPEDVELARTLGIIVYRRGDYARAEQLLTESARKRADDAELLYYLGMSQNRLKKSKESKDTLSRALALKLNLKLAEEARRVLSEGEGPSAKR